MARQEIDLTTPQPNGKMGEPTKSAWEKVNDMTQELYDGDSALSTQIQGVLEIATAALPKSGGQMTGPLTVSIPNAMTVGQSVFPITASANSGSSDSVFLQATRTSGSTSSGVDWYLFRRIGSVNQAIFGMPGSSMGPTAGGPTLGYGGVLHWGIYSANGSFFPILDNTYAIGTPAFRSSVVYSATGSINTSDAREKTELNSFSADEISAAKDIAKEIGFYKFLSSIYEKGDLARWHAGLTVQRVIEIMSSYQLDPFAYSFICHDSWEETPSSEATEHAEYYAGRAAGDRYSFRPDGLMMFIARGLEARISEIESKLNDFL